MGKRVAEHRVADEEVVRLVLREDARGQLVRVEDRRPQRPERARGVHLRGERHARAREGQHLRRVAVNDALHRREGFVDLCAT